ncbi:MAG: vanadium-dependent haloperoxidase, partial [Candidatus Eisenbacteria bacterium]
IRMRKGLIFAIPAVLVMLASGCARDRILAPAREPSSTDASYSPQFVLHSLDDPALPAPGREAEAATTQDGALLDRLQMTRRPGPGGDTPSAIVFWNRLTTELGVGANQPPPLLARSYALVQVGIFEALTVAHDRRRPGISQRAAAAGVASGVLAYLFPASTARIDAAGSEELSRIGGQDGSVPRGWSLGRAIGRTMVARGMHDRSDAVYTGTPPTGDEIWTGTNPVLPMCGTWKTWVLRSGDEIAPEPPYAFGSALDLHDTQEVLDVSLARTPEQIAIVHKWADRSPPAIWNEMLNARIESRGLSAVEAARAQAFLNVAMADAFIECWACKFKYWTARPFQRIPGLVTVIPTPNFPTYTSGHSTISAAAAAVLGEIFPDERDYFVQQSLEAAMSRLYGGIHFRHDNEQGTFCGTLIGQKVVKRMHVGEERGELARN